MAGALNPTGSVDASQRGSCWWYQSLKISIILNNVLVQKNTLTAKKHALMCAASVTPNHAIVLIEFLR